MNKLGLIFLSILLLSVRADEDEDTQPAEGGPSITGLFDFYATKLFPGSEDNEVTEPETPEATAPSNLDELSDAEKLYYQQLAEWEQYEKDLAEWEKYYGEEEDSKVSASESNGQTPNQDKTGDFLPDDVFVKAIGVITMVGLFSQAFTMPFGYMSVKNPGTVGRRKRGALR